MSKSRRGFQDTNQRIKDSAERDSGTDKEEISGARKLVEALTVWWHAEGTFWHIGWNSKPHIVLAQNSDSFSDRDIFTTRTEDYAIS